MRYREPGQPLPAPNRPPRSPLATEATPYLGVRNSPVVTGRLAKASLGDRESVFEVLELVGGDDDRGRLVPVGDRDPFPVPGSVAHPGLQGWNDPAEEIDSAMTPACPTRPTDLLFVDPRPGATMLEERLRPGKPGRGPAWRCGGPMRAHDWSRVESLSQ